MAQTTYTLPFAFIDRPARTVGCLEAIWKHAPGWGLTVISFGISAQGRMRITLSDPMTADQIDHLKVNDPDAPDEM